MASFPKAGNDSGPYSVLGVTVLETAANTLTEAQVATPADPANEVGIVIYKIKFVSTPPDAANPAADVVAEPAVRGRLNLRQGLTSLPDIVVTPGAIAQYNYTAFITSQVADGGSGMGAVQEGEEWDLTPGGILVVDRTISLYSQGTLLQATSRISCLIYYRMVTITSTDLLAAVTLVADVS